MFKKSDNSSPYFKKVDQTRQYRALGKWHIPHSAYPMISANDTDLKQARKNGNSLERRHK